MIKVTDRLYRGPRPTDFTVLKAQGIKLVINLEEGWYDALHLNATYEYIKQAVKNDMMLQCYPLSDFTVPNRNRVDNAIITITAAMDSGLSVYVHCLHGVDRTGYVIAAFRITKMCWTFDAAVAEMISLGFHRTPYAFWIDSLKKFSYGVTG